VRSPGALNRHLSASGLPVGIREITVTDTLIFAWRVNGRAEIRARLAALRGASIVFPLADGGESP
jgi:hypothetical protein